MTKRAAGSPLNSGSGDWFIVAIVADGSVKECLGAVVREQQQKIGFVTALQTNLCAYSGRSTDSVNELRRRTKELEDTLSFRLPLLSLDRPGGWFRDYIYRGVGPFPTVVMTEPVFAAYEAEGTPELKAAILGCFNERKMGVLPFAPPAPCLWLHLLGLNQALEQICVLPAPFSQCRLDELPDTLAREFESPTLSAFLRNVRCAALAAREDLNRCFESLWTTSVKFWDQVPRRSHRTGASRAHEVRSQFRDRRRAMTPPAQYNLSDLSALRFMELTVMPSSGELKRRYLELARKYHPDREGGNEDQFKALAKAYSHLSQRLGRTD